MHRISKKLAIICAAMALAAAAPGAARAACPCSGAAEDLSPWPEWVFGHVVWEDESTTQGTYDLVGGYLERGIPVDGVIIDSPWETEYNTFEFDPALYPDARKLIDDLHERDIRVIMWIVSVVNQEDPAYQTCLDKGYFLKGTEKTKWWKGTGGLIDYENPEAVEWWHRRMDKAIDMGIDGWKCDGTDPYALVAGWNARKRYSHDYYSDFHYYTRERSGRKTAIMARPMVQPFDETEMGLPWWANPLGLGLYLEYAPRDVAFMTWVCDQDSTFDGLRVALRWIMKSAANDYLVIGSDIGGYRDPGPEKELLIRWAQMGAFTPLMENGGGGDHRPWSFDEETVRIYRAYVLLHKAMLDYFQETARDRWAAGTSMITPVGNHKQYLLGDDIFVAPILREGGRRRVKLPAGDNWVPLFETVGRSEEAARCAVPESDPPALEGGCSFTRTYALEEFPVFIRQGAPSPFDYGSIENAPGIAENVKPIGIEP